MSLEDQEFYRVAYDFTRPENPETIGLTQERLAEYRRLFDELNLEAGIEKGRGTVGEKSLEPTLKSDLTEEKSSGI